MLGAEEKDRPALLKQLEDQAIEASNSIKLMAQKRRENYNRLVDGRKRELESMVKKLGGPSDLDKKAIQSVFGKQ